MENHKILIHNDLLMKIRVARFTSRTSMRGVQNLDGSKRIAKFQKIWYKISIQNDGLMKIRRGHDLPVVRVCGAYKTSMVANESLNFKRFGIKFQSKMMG